MATSDGLKRVHDARGRRGAGLHFSARHECALHGQETVQTWLWSGSTGAKLQFDEGNCLLRQAPQSVALVRVRWGHNAPPGPKTLGAKGDGDAD